LRFVRRHFSYGELRSYTVRSLVFALLLAGTFRVGCDCATPTTGSGAPPQVALAYVHGCRLDDGIVSCFGDTTTGSLGVGDNAPREVPTPVSAPKPFVYVTAMGMDTDNATCALDSDGDVWCWGDNTRGQLGQGDFLPRAPVPQRVPLPFKVRRLGHAQFNVVCVIAVDGTLWCWGQNDEGQLGQGDFPHLPDQASPVQVTAFNDWIDVATSEGHACAIRDGGITFCWGRNTDAELGLPSDAGGQLRSPQLVPGRFDSISLGESETCALDGARLYCWGSVPKIAGFTYGPTEMLPGHTWAGFGINVFHVCALDHQGQVFCWGRNVEGQLGLGDYDDRDAGTPLPGTWLGVVTGRFDTCVVGDGGVYCTGENTGGRLGLGDAGTRFNTLQRQP
jgi:alpha-tubulin suppressor-like RCC1 family protein